MPEEGSLRICNFWVAPMHSDLRGGMDAAGRASELYSGDLELGSIR